MINNRVYSCQLHTTIGPTIAFINRFSIDSPKRRFKIKSVYWDVYIIDATGAPLNFNTQVTQRCSLNLGLGVPHITDFVTPGGGSVFNQNGDNIQLNKPGQIIFNSWFVNETLVCSYLGVNLDLLLTHEHFTTVIIETEEE